MASRPQNVGVKAIEMYFPSQCVDQAELEKFDGVSTGKYTIGLGQTKMSFCDDREDIYSFALTTVSSLLKKYSIDPKSIGRLEVGTETLLDKSKSVKSVLMQLFQESGNNNVEGVDTVNACYGGTNALFNAINWVESSAWDGRDAIVVAGDIALYAKGNARPTGGAGCVAMLIGPNAPIALEPGMRGTHMQHVYDFYKPDLTSEYPVVDGHYSVTCYTQALDACYKAYNEREQKLQGSGMANGVHESRGERTTPLDRFDYMLFHSPACKLVAKSYGRLLYNDFRASPDSPAFEPVPKDIRDLSYEASLTDKNVEKTFMGLSKKHFQARVQPSIQVPTMCGNMYCASVYGSLVALLSNISSEQIKGRRIGVFSYGSGLASSFFSMRVVGDTSEMATKVDLQTRLDNRRTVPPEVYDEMCELRKKAHMKKGYTPSGNVNTIVAGTYYLTEVNDLYQRKYEIKA
ncbi:3-hydroxy-3-methylglutaryl coenzyme A synthase [Bacidia gigantensis]|uniref:3-hydroxy-3-methylglutaryl coenzyme A synthase n=1 Tax=Bacidia gigantensis TaxID=2732470 RepID=UPI001D049E66|nr:3-hydroxy-3-methylglutaryl coenzyme A synthase [Bacidia gigantensis]KAG8525967.1 3-hydroxy-3-methylglutaryl coenzyme A synthase [Bacidia gigantensis]